MPIEINRREYEIICDSSAERTLVIDALLKQGYRWHSEPAWQNGNQIEYTYAWRTFPIVVVHIPDKHLQGRRSTDGDPFVSGESFLREMDETAPTQANMVRIVRTELLYGLRI